MDIGVSPSFDVNNCHGLYIYTPESTTAATQILSVDKLGNNVTELLNIQDDKDGIPSSQPPHDKYEKYFSNSTTFPHSRNSAIDADVITAKESTPENPKPGFKPVSAMKGSREKRGVTPPQKLTVKWAPDVYDPVPTSVSHAVTNNKPQKKSEKTSKSKQKNGSKSSRGSKYKDKKQGRKRGGNSSSASLKLPEHEEEEEEVVVVDYGEPSSTAMEFHVGNPDQFCGSSFLKRYDINLHLSSVGEAT